MILPVLCDALCVNPNLSKKRTRFYEEKKQLISKT
nr:MAG TPA: hypothetical protein [Caudoviricetes sp.]